MVDECWSVGASCIGLMTSSISTRWPPAEVSNGRRCGHRFGDRVMGLSLHQWDRGADPPTKAVRFGQVPGRGCEIPGQHCAQRHLVQDSCHSPDIA